MKRKNISVANRYRTENNVARIRKGGKDGGIEDWRMGKDQKQQME